MRIGNLPKNGEAVLVGKWIIGAELHKCPRSMHRVFKPQLFICCVKIVDAGEEWKLGGRPQVRKGFFREFTFPFGVVFEII